MADLARYTPIVLLGAGCLLISGLREQKQVAPRAPMTSVVLEAPGYTKTDVPVPDEERKIAGMDDYIRQGFQRDSLDPGFSIYVGYYTHQVQGKTIHSPKNCLPGAGWEQISAGVQNVPVDGRTVPVNRYLLANKGVQALVYYWYQGRGRAEANEYKVKWNLLRDAALHGRTEEALVRIVVPLDPKEVRGNADGAQRAYARADSLASAMAVQLVPRVDRALPLAPSA